MVSTTISDGLLFDIESSFAISAFCVSPLESAIFTIKSGIASVAWSSISATETKVFVYWFVNTPNADIVTTRLTHYHCLRCQLIDLENTIRLIRGIVDNDIALIGHKLVGGSLHVVCCTVGIKCHSLSLRLVPCLCNTEIDRSKGTKYFVATQTVVEHNAVRLQTELKQRAITLIDAECLRPCRLQPHKEETRY